MPEIDRGRHKRISHMLESDDGMAGDAIRYGPTWQNEHGYLWSPIGMLRISGSGTVAKRGTDSVPTWISRFRASTEDQSAEQARMRPGSGSYKEGTPARDHYEGMVRREATSRQTRGMRSCFSKRTDEITDCSRSSSRSSSGRGRRTPGRTGWQRSHLLPAACVHGCPSRARA